MADEPEVTLDVSVLIKSLAEYRAGTPEKPHWLVHSLIPKGALINIDGKPKDGKTTWLLAMCAKITSGQPFMGLETSPTGVLFLTEQNDSFRVALDRAGLGSSANFHILSLRDTRPLTWEAVMAGLATYCRNHPDIGIVLVDTLNKWAAMGATMENDAGAVFETTRPLQPLLEQGLSVINSLHSRKSFAEIGDSARGSNALTGEGDVILKLGRLPGNQQNKNLRQLESRSRYDETPERIVIELQNGVYTLRGTSSALKESDTTEWLRAHLPATEEEALTEEDLLRIAGDQVSRSTLKRALAGAGVSHTGSGRAHSPYRYYKSSAWRVTVEGKGFIV